VGKRGGRREGVGKGKGGYGEDGEEGRGGVEVRERG